MLMKLLLFGANAFSLVECFFGGCYYNPLFSGTDLEPLCWKWWDKALHDYGYRNSYRGECVNLIKEKCPHMITLERLDITRSYKSGKYEEWGQDVRATLNSETRRPPVIYLHKQTFPVCWDDNGQVIDCDYWWLLAKYERAKNEYKELCIRRILHHCPSMIEKVSEANASSVQRWLKTYDVKTVTYKRTGVKKEDTASFNIYVRGLNNPFEGVQYKQM